MYSHQFLDSRQGENYRHLYNKMMLIARPNWPEMYCNLTVRLDPPERVPRHDPMVLVVLFVGFILAFHLKQHVTSESSIFFGLLCCSIGLLLAPVLGLLLFVFFIYRHLVMCILSRKPGYVGLMDGSDAYWALEEDASRAIINILAYVEYEPKVKQGTANLKTVIKATIQSRLLTNPQLYKLKCQKKLSQFGYYYWQEHMSDIDEHIRWMDLKDVTEETLIDYISECCNKPLPYNNKTFWEVLVSNEQLLREGKKVYPVLFRVHHSVGDGISLVSMFLNSFTDLNEGKKPINPIQLIHQKQKLSRMLTKEVSKLEQIINKVSKSIGAQITKRNSFKKMHNEFKKLNRHCIYSMTGFLQKISVLIFAPIVLTSQVIMGKDASCLHGKTLSGKKHACMATGKDCLTKVKKIKEELKCHFTDVVLIAVSDSLENYFRTQGKPPDSLTMVIPARLPNKEIINGVSVPTNAFTVAMMKLPIADAHKLQSICLKTRKLRIEPHYVVNYWLLRVACTYCPLTLIKNSLRSEQATLALSNIPGPAEIIRIDGNKIHDLVFWVPNRDTTGVGVSLLSYAGKLTFGLMIDHALVPDRKDVKKIVDGFVTAIDKMYDCVSELN